MSLMGAWCCATCITWSVAKSHCSALPSQPPKKIWVPAAFHALQREDRKEFAAARWAAGRRGSRARARSPAQQRLGLLLHRARLHAHRADLPAAYALVPRRRDKEVRIWGPGEAACATRARRVVGRAARASSRADGHTPRRDPLWMLRSFGDARRQPRLAWRSCRRALDPPWGRPARPPALSPRSSRAARTN